MLSGFDHAAIAVHDLAAGVDTYTKLLGRPPVARERQGGVDVASFALANTRIQLLSPRGRAAALRDHLEQRGEGLYAIAFATGDAKAAAEALAARGLGPIRVDPHQGRHGRSGEPDADDREDDAALPHLKLRRSQTRGVGLLIVEPPGPHRVEPGAPLGEPSAVTRLDHVVVRTALPEASIHLYEKQLGIRLALDRTFGERGVRLIFFRIGGVTVELAARAAGATDPEVHDLLSGLAYGVDDVHAAQARVQAAGFDTSEVRSGNKPGTLVCTVRSPTHWVPTLLIGPAPEP
jgi:catechol 2,3-dioxygenase-like lactoylglutathione lyase family enzyme